MPLFGWCGFKVVFVLKVWKIISFCGLLFSLIFLPMRNSPWILHFDLALFKVCWVSAMLWKVKCLSSRYCFFPPVNKNISRQLAFGRISYNIWLRNMQFSVLPTYVSLTHIQVKREGHDSLILMISSYFCYNFFITWELQKPKHWKCCDQKCGFGPKRPIQGPTGFGKYLTYSATITTFWRRNYIFLDLRVR